MSVRVILRNEKLYRELLDKNLNHSIYQIHLN